MFLAYVAIGAALGGAMIVTRTGPGIIPRPQAPTPASRNATRTQSLKLLQTALSQYQHDHGSLPVKLSSAATGICTSFGSYCTQFHLADLSFLYTGGNYIPTMPTDPLGGQATRATGFDIQRLSDGSLKLTAPEAEAGVTIAVTFAP
jgi:type II secretory pathway pseudopilin PulG